MSPPSTDVRQGLAGHEEGARQEHRRKNQGEDERVEHPNPHTDSHSDPHSNSDSPNKATVDQCDEAMEPLLDPDSRTALPGTQCDKEFEKGAGSRRAFRSPEEASRSVSRRSAGGGSGLDFGDQVVHLRFCEFLREGAFDPYGEGPAYQPHEVERDSTVIELPRGALEVVRVYPDLLYDLLEVRES